VVLKKGRIVEQGTPVDLLAGNGVYAEMFRMQQVKQELVNGD
jgi:ABC-type multidrug transport system fused ATPase/permease subunit